ncbi:hypothetical protein H0H93_006435 [Arthromyces matolae]|nr:hypothetical protein H0H93_006435 [Arthromyces matolae]
MATPSSLNILDLSGTYTLNHEKSTKNLGEILNVEGVGLIKRKAIELGGLTVKITHVKDAEGVEHITSANFLPGGIAGPVDKLDLDWEERRVVHEVFGAIVGRMRRTTIENLQVEGQEDKDNESLITGWTDDTVEHGVIQFFVKSDTEKNGKVWVNNETWGIEVIDGERRFARHLKVTGPTGDIIYAKMVYDYVRPL